MKKYTYTFLALLLCTSVYGQTQIENSPIYYSGDNVGIGIDTPGTYKLNIKQDGAAPGMGIKLQNSAGTKSLQLWTGTGGAVLDAEGSTNLHFRTAGNDRLFIANNGLIGIGTTAPNAKLDVRDSGIPVGTPVLAVNNTFANNSDDYLQNKPFAIRRNTSNSEAIFSFLTDTKLNYVYQNDESYGRIHYRIINTDTETGGGASANDNMVMTMFSDPGGSGISIGTNEYNSTYKLSVGGLIRASEIKVQNVPQSDYVFEPEYNLLPLTEVETFIKENKHLPEIPSAEEFKENGVGLGEMDDMLLRKVEELTLYVIEQNKNNAELLKKIEELKMENEKQNEENKRIKKALENLKLQTQDEN